MAANAPLLADPKVLKAVKYYWYHAVMNNWASHPRFEVLSPGDLSAASWNLPLLAAANVKYLITQQSLAGLGAEVPVQSVSSSASNIAMHAYRIPGNFARAYLVKNIKVLPTAERVLAALQKATLSQLRDNVYVSRTDARVAGAITLAKNLEDCGTSHITDYSPDNIAIRIDAKSPCVLVISNNYDRYWSAQIDGKASEIFYANHTFQGIFIPSAGKHHVTLSYNDPRFPMLLWLLPLGAMLLFFVPLISRRFTTVDVSVR